MSKFPVAIILICSLTVKETTAANPECNAAAEDLNDRGRDSYKQALKHQEDNVKLSYKYEKKALKLFNRAIEADSQCVKAWNSKAFALAAVFEKHGESGVEEGYKKAIEACNKVIGLDSTYTFAWEIKAFALFRLKRYEEAIEVCDEVTDSMGLQPDYAWKIKVYALAALANLFYNLGNLDCASRTIEQAISLVDRASAKKKDFTHKDFTSVWTLKGKIKIEEGKYDSASQIFQEAIGQDLRNPSFPAVLWDIYAKYLHLKFSIVPTLELKDTTEYQERISAIIRQLERVNLYLSERSKEDKNAKEYQAYVLYFLGYSYYVYKAFPLAMQKLRDCVELGADSPVVSLADELLDGIWNYRINPGLWRWWLDSPLYRWQKRVVFTILSFLLFAVFLILLLHPFLNRTISWRNCIAFAVFLAILLFSPKIERISTRGLEVELSSPSVIEPVLSPSVIASQISEIERDVQGMKTLCAKKLFK